MRAYLRWIDATTRRPDLRAARIAEVVGVERIAETTGGEVDEIRADASRKRFLTVDEAIACRPVGERATTR